MKSLVLSAFIIAIAKSGFVPPALSDFFSASCTTCDTAADCATAYGNDNITWQCVEPTNSSIMLLSMNYSVCAAMTCMNNTDCATGEECNMISCCDDPSTMGVNDTAALQYLSGFNGAYSTMCLRTDICDVLAFNESGEMNETCVTGADMELYESAEEAVICGGVCVWDDDTGCYQANTTYFTTTEENEEVWEDCTGDFAFMGCMKVLFTDGLWYSIGALALILLCCCGCIVLCVRKKKSTSDHEDMDTQTNHYNVYI